MAGETTSVSVATSRAFYDNPGAGAFFVPFSLTYSTVQNELNDVMEAGYIPANTRVVAVYWGPTDMDSSTAAVHKVTVGSTDVVTGLTGAQTGTASWNAVTSTAVATAVSSSPALVKVTTTTAAGTAVAGTATLMLLCQKATA